MIIYCLYKLGQFLILRLPTQISYLLADFLSDLNYFLNFHDRRNVENNLKNILSSSSNLNRVVRDMFRNFGRYLVEFFLMEKNLNKLFIQNHVKIQNLNYIDDVLKKGKGGILVTAHIGNWELGGRILSELGYSLTVIALSHKNKAINSLFNNKRECGGNITVVPPGLAARQCLKDLRANKLIAIVGDRDFAENGQVLDFLGKKVLLPKGAAVFSIKTGAPIIPIFLIREERDKYILSIRRPITPSEHGNRDDAEVVSVMRKYVGILQEVICKYPAQWLMFRDYGINAQ